MTIIDDRKAALLARVRDYGGPLNELPVLAQFLAQVMHESGGLRYVREIWGPTKAQARYEGRKDLGNTQPGDGKRFMGRDVIQVTGRANHRALTAWVRKTFGGGPDFEAKPEMVTRRVNGGLNGYHDRLHWYDRIALEILGVSDVRTFQKSAGLVVDGISGPKTRAAMHDALSHVKETPVLVTRPAPHVNADAPKTPAQREVTPKQSQAKEAATTAAGGAAGAGLVLLALVGDAWGKFVAFADWITFWNN